MSVRIEDVARSAGVSTATVSRVINNDGHAVTAVTRRKVEAAIRRLHYTPNIFARGLMKGTTNSVGIIVPFLSNPYFGSQRAGYAAAIGILLFCTILVFTLITQGVSKKREVQY